MTGKGKVENFDDLDTIDEDQWGEETDSAVASEGGASSPEDALRGAKKKSSGGLLFGLVLISLLGGGSWYAYQNQLIPGLETEKSVSAVSASSSVIEEAIPSSSDSLTSSELQNLPPMPQDSSAPQELDLESAKEEGPASNESDAAGVSADSTSLTGDSDGDGVLTPFPGADVSTSDLQPLEMADGEIREIAPLAEKDGMLAQDPSGQVLAPEVAPGTIASTGSESESLPDVGLSDGQAVDLQTPETENTVVIASESDSLSELDLGKQVDEVLESAETLDGSLDAASSSLADSADLTAEKGGILSQPNDLSSLEQPENSDHSPMAVSESSDKEDLEMVSDGDLAESSALGDLNEQPDQISASEPLASPSPSVSLVPAKDSTGGTSSNSGVQPEAVDVSVDKPEMLAQNPVVPDKKAETSPRKPVVVSKKTTPASSWKLRSAQPGSAILYDSRTGDVKSVEIGDRVAGFGKIKSITKVNGKWVIKGTMGSLSQ